MNYTITPNPVHHLTMNQCNVWCAEQHYSFVTPSLKVLYLQLVLIAGYLLFKYKYPSLHEMYGKLIMYGIIMCVVVYMVMVWVIGINY